MGGADCRAKHQPHRTPPKVPRRVYEGQCKGQQHVQKEESPEHWAQEPAVLFRKLIPQSPTKYDDHAQQGEESS